MKEGWTNKTLGEVCKIYNGNSINADYKKKHFLGATGGLPFIATKDVSPLGIIDYYNGVRIPNYEKYKVAPANSVFICAEGGSAGKKFAYVEKDVCFGNKLFCITPKDNSITGKFVYHFVQSDNFRGQFFSLLTGLIGGVSAKKFQTIEIPVPTLTEQLSIVAYLDSAFAKIDAMKANAEKALNEAKALFQASLKEMLEPKEGWEKKTINDIVYFRNGSAHEKEIDKGGKFVVINSKFVSTNGRVRKYTNEQLSPLYNNEIVMVMSDVPKGKTLAKCYIIECDDKYSLNQRICAFKSKGLDINFLYYLLNRNPHLLKYDNGENQTNLRKKQILECPVSFPSLANEQQSIVATLDALKSKVDKLQENFDKISQECDALKQAILRQIFE